MGVQNTPPPPLPTGKSKMELCTCITCGSKDLIDTIHFIDKKDNKGKTINKIEN